MLSLLLLPAMTARLSAQAPQQDWPPDDAYSAQYPPAPQGYGQGSQYGYAPPQNGYAAPQNGYGPSQNPQAQPYPQSGYAQQLSPAQPLSPDQLTQLVAPIALYPDSLVAQILAASTYPAQVSAADRGLREQGNASPDQIAAWANAQTSWDPSVKALTAFPQVLAMLDGNLQWTTNLGNAYYNQPQDVLQTIQVMRQRAEDAGNLQNTPQEQVSENQGFIDIAPVNPQIVYVPTYNPWAVYGAPVSPYPGFSFFGALGSFFGASPIQYGLSFAMSAFLHTPWGFLGWGLDWLGHAILFNHNGYMTRSTSVADWGFPRGGPRAFPGRPEMGRGFERFGGAREGLNRGYNRPGEGFERGYGQPVGRPVARYGDARTAEGFNHGYPARGGVYGGAEGSRQEAYNRYPQTLGRAQAYGGYGGRQSYGSSFANQPRSNLIPRQGTAFSTPAPAYRSPESGYRESFGGRNYGSFGGGEMARSQHAGGFHPFGGGRQSETWRSSSSAGAWKAPKASHFSGGGHSGGSHSGGHEHSSGHHR